MLVIFLGSAAIVAVSFGILMIGVDREVALELDGFVTLASIGWWPSTATRSSRGAALDWPRGYCSCHRRSAIDQHPLRSVGAAIDYAGATKTGACCVSASEIEPGWSFEALVVRKISSTTATGFPHWSSLLPLLSSSFQTVLKFSCSHRHARIQSRSAQDRVNCRDPNRR